MAPGAQGEEDVGAITKHPSTERNDRYSAAQRPLTHPEINYTCFHITVQSSPWGTLTPSTPYILPFLCPTHRPPILRRPRQGNGQATVTQSKLLQLMKKYHATDYSIYGTHMMA